MSSKSLAQLRSFTKVLYLQKRRNIRVCCCETFSHLFLFVLLLMGYGLSKVLFLPSQAFYTVDVPIPPIFLKQDIPMKSEVAGDLSRLINFQQVLLYADNVLQHPILTPTFDQYMEAQSFLNQVFQNRRGQLNFLFSSAFGSRYGNLIRKGAIHFAPYPSNLVDNLVTYLNTTTRMFKTLTIRYHSNEDVAVEYILDNLRERTFALVVLREISIKKVNYVIRMNYTALPNTNEIIVGSPGIDNLFQTYFKSGYMTMQQTVDEWVFHYINTIYPSSASSRQFCSRPPSVRTVYEPYPVYEYNQNPFFAQVGFLLGVAMVMSTLYPVSRLVKTIVEEKETRMRELMLIMGLETWVHDLAWWLMSFLLFFWIAISVTYVTKTSFLPNSSAPIVFAYFFLFMLALMQFSFFIAVFFNNSKLAAIVAPVVLFSTILPRYIFFDSNNNENVKPKIGASLLLPTAFTFGADILAQYEDDGIGVQFSNITSGGYSFATCLGMMIFDFFLYSMLSWYFDKVLPREFGVRQHPLFFLNLYYWFPKTCFWMKTKSHTAWDNINQNVSINVDSISSSTSHIEPIAIGLQPSIKIELDGLTKVYPDGKLAVKGLSMCLLEDQITCLLGANGAGKSTTMSMLTGLVPPTSGTCNIYGFSLLNEMFKIRTITGICFQHDVIFPQLTVREHVTFFGIVKGISLWKIHKEVKDLVEEVGLAEKINTPAGSLSGGMKRKLCLAMALIGSPKFLLIDECTSGMDPAARRATWEILQKRKKGCAILLCTHYMFEADYLGDRIAIMSEGELIAMGTSLFLKSSLGDGYVLTLSKESPDCNVDKVTELITNILPNSELSQVVAGEITFRLDIESTSKFSDLLAALQKDGKSLGIGSFGLSLSSLEQVFVRLASKNAKNDKDIDNLVIETKRNFFFGRNKQQSKTYQEIQGTHTNSSSSELASRPAVVDLESECITYDEWLAVETKDDPNKNDINHDDVDLSIISDNDSVPADSSLKSDDFDIGYEKMIGVQLYQLFYKRYKIATRDLKGFFFQVIFPAAQVLLVLAILTININPAGHTIIMNASMFPKSGNGRQNLELAQFRGSSKSFFFDSISSSNANILNNTVPTSSERMSDRFLGDDLTGKRRKTQPSMGAIILSDSVPLNITVNWYWVKNNAPAILSYQQELQAITQINLTSLSYQNFSLITNQPLVDNLLKNDIFTAIALQVLNNQSISTTNTVVKAATISYNPATYSIVLSNTTVSNNGIDIGLGTISVSIYEILPFLPDDTIGYTLYVDNDYTIMHNTSSPHAVGAFNGELLDAAFSKCFNPDAQYLSKNHPLPVTKRQALEIKLILSFLASIFVLVPLCYIPASFVSFLVKERSSKAKHLQLISGVSSNMYWVATYMWDMSLFTILALFVLCAFAIYGTQSAVVFISDSIATLSLFMLLITYGTSVIPLSYLYSFGFENHSTAQISIMAINFFTGFVAVLAYFIMSTIPQTQAAAKVLVHLFRFFPPYCLGEGLIAISRTYFVNTLFGYRRKISFFAWSVTGRPILLMTVESIGYFALVLLSEHWTMVWIKQKIDKFRVSESTLFHNAEENEVVDSDVDTERLLIDEKLSDLSSHALLIKGLTKQYPPSFLGGQKKKAVKNLNLACKYGDIFGLLGMNGAGKSTTLSIITADNLPTNGDVFVCGLPLSNPLTRLYIGYCPQSDPILELLNSYETLFFYGRIRGIKEEILKKRVNDLIIQVGLAKHAVRPCGTYSGGNKRKLSLAVALIGDPKLLVLDEPSSGMDPYARRQMWDVISAVSKQRCVILTTHSMEECEALCGRLTIMAMGKMQCIGSVQHLKSRFGSGYSIELRIGSETSALPQLSLDDKIKMIQDALPLRLDEFRVDYIRFTGDNDLILEDAFKYVEEKKTILNIIDYSISQFPLEQIFNKFAHNETDINAIN